MLSSREFFAGAVRNFSLGSAFVLAVLWALLELLGAAAVIVGVFLYAGYATAFQSFRSLYLKLRSL